MPRGRKKSQIHPGRECGPCHFFQATSTHYSRLHTWEERLKVKVKELNDKACLYRKYENMKKTLNVIFWIIHLHYLLGQRGYATLNA